MGQGWLCWFLDKSQTVVKRKKKDIPLEIIEELVKKHSRNLKGVIA